jgi:hypothetical protein
VATNHTIVVSASAAADAGVTNTTPDAAVVNSTPDGAVVSRTPDAGTVNSTRDARPADIGIASTTADAGPSAPADAGAPIVTSVDAGAPSLAPPPPSFMTPTFVQVGAATPQTPQTQVAVTLLKAQQAGDLNVVVVGWNDAVAQVASITDGSGNAYTLATGPIAMAGVVSQSVYYAKNIAGAAAGNLVTVKFNQAAKFVDLRVLEYHGIDPTSPFDGAAGAAASTSAGASGTITTIGATELLVGANTVYTSTVAAGGGFTSRMITAPDGDIAEDQVVTAPGTYNAQSPLSGAGPWVMQMVAFRAASATAVP